MIALYNQLKVNNWFQQQGIPMPQPADWLDLVALGTISDLVPLDRNNRILVSQGLKRITFATKSKNPAKIRKKPLKNSPMH